jgi:hypothetical protein
MLHLQRRPQHLPLRQRLDVLQAAGVLDGGMRGDIREEPLPDRAPHEELHRRSPTLHQVAAVLDAREDVQRMEDVDHGDDIDPLPLQQRPHHLLAGLREPECGDGHVFAVAALSEDRLGLLRDVLLLEVRVRDHLALVHVGAPKLTVVLVLAPAQLRPGGLLLVQQVGGLEPRDGAQAEEHGQHDLRALDHAVRLAPIPQRLEGHGHAGGAGTLLGIVHLLHEGARLLLEFEHLDVLRLGRRVRRMQEDLDVRGRLTGRRIHRRASASDEASCQHGGRAERHSLAGAGDWQSLCKAFARQFRGVK